MQIILLERVPKLGQMGDVVTVKPGYARNFLIPGGKARRATSSAIKEFEDRRADLEKAQAQRLAAAQAEGEKLAGLTVQLTEKAGVDGRLFGSVTPMNVVEALRKQGFASVEKTMVRFPEGPLKTLGLHAVTVALHPEVEVTVKVNIARSQDEADLQAGKPPQVAEPEEEERELTLEEELAALI